MDIVHGLDALELGLERLFMNHGDTPEVRAMIAEAVERVASECAEHRDHSAAMRITSEATAAEAARRR